MGTLIRMKSSLIVIRSMEKPLPVWPMKKKNSDPCWIMRRPKSLIR
nr:MAG TPA: hypothetical protein [Caudoviricetes sp.]